LIDAESGHHVWADRYDRMLDDIFELQDEITDAIVGALEPALGEAERTRTTRRATENLDAWELYQRGMWHFQKTTKEDFVVALDMFQRATQLDAEFAAPLSGVSGVHLVSVLLTWAENPAEVLGEALGHAQSAIALDPSDAFANTMLTYTTAVARRYDESIAAGKSALRVNPSFAFAHHALGVTYLYNGEPELAVESVSNALRISPQDGWLHMWLSTLSAAHYMTRDYDKALENARAAVQRAPHYLIAHRTLASALAQLGDLDAAREALAAFLKLSPNHTEEAARRSVAFRTEEDFAHYCDGLRKAGWQG
jgi:adenylate cyclase